MNKEYRQQQQDTLADDDLFSAAAQGTQVAGYMIEKIGSLTQPQ